METAKRSDSMILRCGNCKSTDIRQEITIMIDPNDPDHMKDLDKTALYFNGFEYCVECQDITHSYESEE